MELLDINFQTQLTKTTFGWCDKYKYDFYFEHDNEQYIIETHGGQHYQYNSSFSLSLEETQENDRIKKELALVNGIKEENYIVIDCRYSNFDFVKQNILNSKLNKIFNLSEVNWKECEKTSNSNLVKEICEYWNNKKEYETTSKLIKHFKLSNSTVNKYLKIGDSLGWCKYSPTEENKKCAKRASQSRNKQIEVFKNGISVGVFNSARECSNQSEELFGIKLDYRGISAVCLGKRKTYNKLVFKYC